MSYKNGPLCEATQNTFEKWNKLEVENFSNIFYIKISIARLQLFLGLSFEDLAQSYENCLR